MQLIQFKEAKALQDQLREAFDAERKVKIYNLYT